MTNNRTSSDPIADLWATARAWMAVLMKRFGGPVRILAALCARTRNAIKRRLAAIDALVLKLLLIEALRRDTAPAPASPAACAGPAAAACNQHLAAPEDPDDPETWRVRYRTRLPRRLRPRALGASAAPAVPRSAETLARALARRCEALRRLLDDPSAAIAALARKLCALAAAAGAIMRRIAMTPAPRGAPDRMRFAEAIVCACDTLNSS